MRELIYDAGETEGGHADESQGSNVISEMRRAFNEACLPSEACARSIAASDSRSSLSTIYM